MDSDATPQSITLAVDAEGAELGTLTLNFDGHRGQVAESLRADEIASLRAEGRQLSECTRLTFNTKRHARRIFWIADQVE